MSFEYYCSVPWGLRQMDLIYSGESIYNKRCRDIQEQLAEYDLIATVGRHDLFDVDYYLIEFNNNGYGGGKYPSCGKIAEALDIPNECVNLYTCEYKSRTVYAVKEGELHCRYLNDDGRLEWDNPFDFYEAVNSGNPNSRIKKQLEYCRRVVSCYKDKGIILIDCSSSAKCVADGLGICEESVIDVSCTLKESGITHIIIIEEE